MARITILVGAILTILGVGAYALAMTGDDASVTALIPAFFGIPLAALGIAAERVPARRALMVHIAVVLALLGLIGAARGLPSLPKLFTSPDDVARPAAVIVQSVMALICLVYIVLAVRSFIAARRSAD